MKFNNIYKFFYLWIGFTFQLCGYAENNCSSHLEIHNHEMCEVYWKCTTAELLGFWLKNNKLIHRTRLSQIDLEYVSHTPIWLRILEGKLYCVRHPHLPSTKYLHLKPYRARHYVNRLNRILKYGIHKIPNGTEWWTHYSDIVKVPMKNDSVPIFGVAGYRGYAQIAGIPFMSFSDKISAKENKFFQGLEKTGNQWSERSEVAFFHGSLSDCRSAKENFQGDVKFCARAKVILEATRSKNPLLKSIKVTSNFRNSGLNVDCPTCSADHLSEEDFVKRLLEHKYLLNLPGAGPWSRRMSTLMRAGGTIFQAESSGYQFYELQLKPGVHYIPFDPQIGQPGAGNLISRLVWAKENDGIARGIALQAENFAKFCLKEQSIDFFVATLLAQYSKLLFGNMTDFPLMDLSACITKTPQDKVSRICRGIIERCWE